MRQLGFCLGLATALAWGAAARAADFVWLEGEKPSSSNYPKLDLGNWAAGKYVIPGAPAPREDPDEPEQP